MNANMVFRVTKVVLTSTILNDLHSTMFRLKNQFPKLIIVFKHPGLYFKHIRAWSILLFVEEEEGGGGRGRGVWLKNILERGLKIRVGGSL